MPTVTKVHRPWIRKPESKGNHQGGDNANRYVYNSYRHIKNRERHLRENPLCVICRKEGRLFPATVYDHIVPINRGGDPWDESNKQGLCNSCHQKKRVTERG
jgi:5-methylcytosine-specific restriction protein A